VTAAKAAAKPAPEPAPDDVLVLKRRWFGLVPPKCDRTYEGFIRAIRAALKDLGEVEFRSPMHMSSSVAEHIRRQLNAPPMSIEVDWAGTRKTSRATRLIIETAWGHREDVEGSLSFKLFET
jgi:hypothetical protein